APFIVWQRVRGESLRGAGAAERRLAFAVNRRAAALWLQARSFADTLGSEYAAAGRAAEWRVLSQRVRVLGNGGDVPPVAGDARRAVPPWRVLFIGRLDPLKNLQMLVDAARRAPECEVWIAGAGPERAALEARADGTGVRFLGEQPHERVGELLA